jgi:hypothetical protein
VHITTTFWQKVHLSVLWMMWIIHGYHPYPQEFIHHPWIFTRMHPDASMVVPSPAVVLACSDENSSVVGILFLQVAHFFYL